MFHLFKKVYLDFDDKISMSYDRVICSNEYGGIPNSVDLSKVFYGETIASKKSVSELIGDGNPFSTLLDMFITLNSRVDSTDSRVFVYCDRESYYKLAIQYMKIVTPWCTGDSAWKFFKSHIFKEKNFANSRLSATERFTKESETWMLMESEFKTYWDQISVSNEERAQCSSFLTSVSSNMRVEFLLAGYLYDGRYANELAASMSPLVKKDLEKFLYEQKEIILVHLQRPRLQELLGVVNGPYTFENFYDMVNDPAPLVQLMFREDIWGETKSSMYSPSSAGTINFAALTDTDIENLKQFSKITGQIWSEATWYSESNKAIIQSFEASEVDKFDFIKMFRNKDILTPSEMQTILDYELYHQYHVAGSFYSIDLRTVNTYFVDFVLQNSNNKELLKPYIFEIVS